jgi:hypothetical protein
MMWRRTAVAPCLPIVLQIGIVDLLYLRRRDRLQVFGRLKPTTGEVDKHGVVAFSTHLLCQVIALPSQFYSWRARPCPAPGKGNRRRSKIMREQGGVGVAALDQDGLTVNWLASGRNLLRLNFALRRRSYRNLDWSGAGVADAVGGSRCDSEVLALAICAGYALLDEAHQTMVPNRGSSLYDVALDCSAALFANFLCHGIVELL